MNTTTITTIGKFNPAIRIPSIVGRTDRVVTTEVNGQTFETMRDGSGTVGVVYYKFWTLSVTVLDHGTPKVTLVPSKLSNPPKAPKWLFAWAGKLGTQADLYASDYLA